MDVAPTAGGPETPDVVVPTPEANHDSEAALINELNSFVTVPTFLQAQFREMSSDRQYVSRDAMLVNSQDTVAVNHVLRNQLLALAYQGTFDPQPFCQPQRQAGGVTSRVDELFAETMEIFLSRQSGLMRLAEIFEGGSQDASTNGYAVFKVTLQHDLMRDALGNARFGDQQEQVALWQTLKAQVDAGTVTEGTSDWQRFKDVDQTLRVFFAGKMMEQIKEAPVMVEAPVLDPVSGSPILDPMTGQPVMQMILDPQDPRELARKAVIDGKEFDVFGLAQVEHYRGFTISQILPEDFRWDWNVIRPEDVVQGRRAGHRVYMSVEAIQTKWKLTDEEVDKIRSTAGARQIATGSIGGRATPSTDQDPSLRADIENTVLNDQIAVWEVWEKASFRRYVFIAGLGRLLENVSPTDVGARFYPFFMLRYNRGTGQVAAISDVRLVRQLQDEANMLRSHDRELKRGAYPVLFVPRGTLDKEAKELYRNRYPGAVIEVNNADDVKKYLSESVSVPYNPAATDSSPALTQMQQMFGLPLAVTGGGSGESLASALALAKEGMETGVSWRRVQANRVLTEIFQWMAQIANKAFGLPTVQQIAGPMAVWPQLSADALAMRLNIEVKGGMSGAPRAKDRLDLWMNFATIAQSLGLPVNGVEVLRELLEALGIRVDFSRFIAPIMPQVPGAPTGSAPTPNQGRTPEGGAPLMVDPRRGAPSDMNQVPNNPLPS